MAIRVGIDLGTTFCAVARLDPVSGGPVIIKNSQGSPITPSVLCFTEDGQVLFGAEAKDLQLAGETNTASFFKRSMGKPRFSLEFFGKNYTATELSAILLKKLVEEAEQACGEKIREAVITVPAYFTTLEREATMEAGRQAGLEVLAIINEPTAAALAYGLHKTDRQQTILIYDLGGGTFDVTLARMDQRQVRILGSDGNHELGGKDWDDCIARYLAQQFQEGTGLDLTEDPAMIETLLVTAETVKRQLSSRDCVQVPLTYRGRRQVISLTQETFREISRFLLGTTRDVTQGLLEQVGITWQEVDGVILVGGSTRMKMIHDYVREMSGREPLTGLNVDEAVALGAAIRAELEPETPGLAPGARPAIRGARAITDATAHAMGMIAVSKDGDRYVNSLIIPKNAPIPAGNTRPFQLRTREEYSELEVYVLQGHFPRPLDNTVTGKYVVEKVEKTPGGKAVVEVTYRYNANGVIEVSARQTETGKNLPVRTEPVPEDMSWADGDPREQTGGKARVEVLLALDMSGSMSGTPLKKAKEAMKCFVDSMDPEQARIGLIAVANQAVCEQKPTDNYGKLKRKIDSLTIGGTYGYGNSAHPFDVARKSFSGEADAGYIIVLTDGCWSYADRAVAAAKMCHKQDIQIMALGFGDADYDFLRKIASMDEFASLTDLSGLGGSFSRIAQVIGDSGITAL